MTDPLDQVTTYTYHLDGSLASTGAFVIAVLVETGSTAMDTGAFVGARIRSAIPAGTVVRVLSAWKLDRLVSDSVFYVIQFDSSPFSGSIPVRLELEANASTSGELNPKYFEQLK